MANELTFKLALVSDKSTSKPKAEKAPKPREENLEREVPADGQRHIANECAKDAMVMGWDRAIQKHAYENRIPESELKRLLDQALEYNDKADPSGRIHELEDWRLEKRGGSSLAPKRR